MNKVVTVNLNGKAYQVEEAGYAALKTYLGQAEHSLADNPDREEIIADFEQAIAEKCGQVLSSIKTVVSEQEIATIIRQMGPVDAEGKAAVDDDPAPAKAKRFYLIKEDAMIGGVCTGIAAYCNLDVTVVRFLTVLLSFVTSGAVLAAYVVVMLLAPEAMTPEEKAQARGTEFSSKELLARARQKYALLGDKKHWQQVVADQEPNLSRLGTGIRQALRGISAFVAGIGASVILGLVIVGIASIWSVIFSGQLFGIGLDPAISTSIAALFMASVLIVGAIPILIITVTAYKYAKNSTLHQSIWGLVAALSVFAVALAVSLAIISTTPQLRDVSKFHITQTQHHGKLVCYDYCD